MNRRNFLLSSMGAAALAMVPVLAVDKPGSFAWRTYQIAYTITSEEMYGPLSGDFEERMAQALARSMQQTKELLDSHVLGRVFPDDYTYKTYATACYRDFNG